MSDEPITYDAKDARITFKDVDIVGMESSSVQTTFGFAVARAHLNQGDKVMRFGWNGKGMWLMLIRKGGLYQFWRERQPLEDSGLTLSPFIAMKTVGGSMVPWLASQTDILAEDWSLL